MWKLQSETTVDSVSQRPPWFRHRAFRNAHCRFLLFLLLGLMPIASQANLFELNSLAMDLHRVSARLASEVRHTNGYGTVYRNADRLAREAEQLIDALRRGRGESLVRAQFDDIDRRYRNLESSFLQASRKRYIESAYRDMQAVSDVLAGLHDQYYYAFRSLRPNAVHPDMRRSPVVVVAPRGYNRRGGLVTYPGAFPGRYGNNRGQRQGVSPGRQGQQGGRNNESRPSRFDYGRRTVGDISQLGGVPGNSRFDHRSSVLDRQARLQQGRAAAANAAGRGATLSDRARRSANVLRQTYSSPR